MEKMLCPKWGFCGAKKQCPLKKECGSQLKEIVYVFGRCANNEVEIIQKKIKDKR